MFKTLQETSFMYIDSFMCSGLLLLVTTLWDKDKYRSHFIHEETEAQRVKQLAQSHIDGKRGRAAPRAPAVCLEPVPPALPVSTQPSQAQAWFGVLYLSELFEFHMRPVSEFRTGYCVPVWSRLIPCWRKVYSHNWVGENSASSRCSGQSKVSVGARDKAKGLC